MEEMASNVGRAMRKQDRWAGVSVVAQTSEASDSEVESRMKWSKIYRLFSASGEAAQDEVFAAVNMYFLRNGTSPRGKYRKPIRTAGGMEVISGEVVKEVGRNEGEIRQFMRGRLEDSYLFLKHNVAVRADPEIVAKAQNAGLSMSQAWLVADWLGDNCPHFVGNEADVYARFRASTIALANARRKESSEGIDKVIDDAPENRSIGHSDANYSGGLY